jgi:hypothetical protein
MIGKVQFWQLAMNSFILITVLPCQVELQERRFRRAALVEGCISIFTALSIAARGPGLSIDPRIRIVTEHECNCALRQAAGELQLKL